MLKNLSHDEKERMQTLDTLQEFDTSQDDILNKLTTLACQVLKMPTSLVTLSGSRKQHIKAKTNFALNEMEKLGSFDQFAAQTGCFLICQDAMKDERFKKSPYVSGVPYIRFYAGIPLFTEEGYAIGTLCVIDYVPRTFSMFQLHTLKNLANIAMSLINYRNAIGLVDAVTLLPNRQQLIEDINHMTDIHENYLLILIEGIDVSYAYQMSRALGMPTVEGMLKDIGMFLRLSFNFRENVYCTSLGRFALLVKSDRKEQILTKLKACADSIQESIISHVPLKLELFVGYTEFRIPVSDPQRILRESMSALYDAIDKNVRQCAYHEGSDKAQQLAFTLLNELSDILHNDKPGLYLVYQPKLNIKTREVIGAEALIRWLHPDLGNVLPDRFIPLAEGTTLMQPLTEWVIKQTAQQIKIWRQAGILFPVSINVAASNFAEDKFISRLINNLAEHGLTPADIELECLETQKIVESSETLAAIMELKQRGFTISLDDFGAGYSNLNYLKKIPASIIKLDKSLIQGIKTDHDSRTVVESIISMLHKLNYDVLAEGVEDEETLDYLDRFGCDEVQGYYFARPLTPEDFISWLNNHQARITA
ncbi:diguanylate phosphodiesterase [Brenneria goodwinii]|uniref:Diguanylate phosphodiesterase n=1 Tax=Brenneria goodwinii TaxID=1109412 RepID=A0A0G4K063_9GAMM|nr:EAL domain-containing protein [Brenneria goodwinii]ATA23879.1 diguanylate phosphodiesterase [Brenneria goodwinii]MCG8155826.1 sensor domain-containing phosphodiesterase [Brenneria goodwinii]MCG8160658.1 sensor domain-containing phosphodiesterase [Brenneria goodwinii]MCG8166904.1 sensor domain-containing phosphodiesterase [Brenneria goodwinii]MCG8172800.1 sensor domain-containing phosphodiesterase [Brenneria goodwinii]